MNSCTSGEIPAFAKKLTEGCQAVGLDAEQYGGEVFIRGVSHHLSERIVCRPGPDGPLRWYWSWGTPIGRVNDATRPLDADDVGELVRAIKRVVAPSRDAT